MAAGCCFGPMVTISSGEQVNEWNLSGNLGPLVIGLTHNFQAGTDQSGALAEVRQDLPADATLIKSVNQGACSTFVYTSATLGKAAPKADLGATVSVTLYPPPDATDINAPYTAGHVEQAIEGSGDDSEVGC